MSIIELVIMYSSLDLSIMASVLSVGSFQDLYMHLSSACILLKIVRVGD